MKKSIAALSFGTLGLGISEFVMMGILPDIAHDVNISIPEAGHLISAYALGVCVGAPTLLLMSRKRPLKQILLLLATIYTIANFAFALSPWYGLMLFTRFLAGLPHGAFFGVGSIVAEKLADKGHASTAVSQMVAGMTIANLVGVPLGTWISSMFLWRYTYLLVGCLGVLLFYFLWRFVPYFAPMPDTGLKGQFRFLRHREPWLLLGATMFGNGGVFCLYSYINPLLTRVAGFSESNITTLMVIAGLGMVIGNLLSGKLSDRYTPARVATATQALICISLALFFYGAHDPATAILLTFLCTAGLFAVSSPQQLLLIKNSPGGEMLGAASVQVAFNLGNALGAYCGGLPITLGYNYQYTAPIGATFALIGFLLLLFYTKREERIA